MVLRREESALSHALRGMAASHAGMKECSTSNHVQRTGPSGSIGLGGLGRCDARVHLRASHAGVMVSSATSHVQRTGLFVVDQIGRFGPVRLSC